jgi:hypothetical protein
MKNKYKIAFWICCTVLIGSNTYWIYQTIDNAIGANYYQISCEEYRKDSNELLKALKNYNSKDEMIYFLDIHKVSYKEFQKGSEFIIQLNSFDFTFNENKLLIETNQN